MSKGIKPEHGRNFNRWNTKCPDFIKNADRKREQRRKARVRKQT